MNIREISKRYNISVRALRYYEEIGLLKSNRDKQGVREYEIVEIGKLELIILLKELHLPLKSIKEIIQSETPESLNRLINQELESIDQSIQLLIEKKALLSSVIKTYGSRDITMQTLKAFVKEQLYFSSKKEKLMTMAIQNEHLILEIGEGMIPIAQTLLIPEIKLMRKSIEENHELKVDLIRVRDNVTDLKTNEFRTIVNGEFGKSIACVDQDMTQVVQQMIEHLKSIILA